MSYSLTKLLELEINKPKNVLKLGKNRINPSTAGKLKFYTWEEAIQQKILSSITLNQAKRIFSILGTIPTKVGVEGTEFGGHLPSYYIYGTINGEPLIYARRETESAAAGQTKFYSKYKSIPVHNLIGYINNGKFNKYDPHKDSTKEEILKILKIPTNNEQPINEEETFYHGTSHYFKCFRTAGVGGGSGAQVYGWGLYFGKDVDYIRSYIGIGTHSGKKMLLFQGKTPAELAFEYDCIIFERLPSALTTIDEFIEYAQDMIELLSDDGDNSELISEYKRFIEIIKELNIEQEPMKYVYEVLLHKGKKPSEYEYLNWDKHIPQNQINKINNQAKKEHLNFQISNDLGSNVYHNIENYFKSKGSANAPKDASLFLLRSGIDGNTHSNGSVRIIFDERAITIVNVCKMK